MFSLLSPALLSLCQQRGRSCGNVHVPRKPLEKAAAWEERAATLWFSSLPLLVKCNRSCLSYLHVKVILDAGKWKENECQAGTYFFTKFFFTPNWDPNPAIGSTWLAVLIEIWDEGGGYKQPFCRAALLGRGPRPFAGCLCLTSGCAADAALPTTHAWSAEQDPGEGWLIYPEAEANA